MGGSIFLGLQVGTREGLEQDGSKKLRRRKRRAGERGHSRRLAWFCIRRRVCLRGRLRLSRLPRACPL